MKKFLDKLFGNKYLSILLPIICALVVYLLFILFGKIENKVNLMIAIPILSARCFFGVFLVVFIQVKNSMCPEWFLNLFELLATIFFAIYAIVGIVTFVVSGFQNYNLGIYLYLVAISAISWAHSKRVK